MWEGWFTIGEGGGGIWLRTAIFVQQNRHFLSATHSSTNYTKLNKSPLRQYLSLGLSEVLTKHLIAGTSIASGRMCKGDDLDDRLLMPKLS
jgi:hypothetical protein